MDQYLDALCKELDYVADRFRDKKLNTVYIGGGTPTTLEPYQLDRLLTRIQSKFDTEHLQEFTVQLKDGSSYLVKEPFKVNGFEYEIVETSRCVSCGLNTSDRYTKEDCLTILRLMDDIRESWDMTFEGEEK